MLRLDHYAMYMCIRAAHCAPSVGMITVLITVLLRIKKCFEGAVGLPLNTISQFHGVGKISSGLRPKGNCPCGSSLRGVHSKYTMTIV